MKSYLAALTILLAASAQAADAPPRTKFTAADPALKLVARSDSYESGSSAVWRGTLLLEGKLVIEFDRAPEGEEQPDKDGAAFFEPDPASRKKLPAALNYYRKPVTSVWLGGTGREVALKVIGAQAFETLSTGTDGRYEFPVRLLLSEFSTAVECDSRNYTLQYKSMSLIGSTVTASLHPRNLGC